MWVEKPDRCNEMTYIGGGGVRLAAERWEAGDSAPRAGTALLLHGGGQTRHSWNRTAARLASHGWTAIAVDARGHGDSQWAADADYSLNAFVGDLAAIVDMLDAPPVLIGASLGGMTALVGQGTDPNMARGLVLVDITPRVEPAGRERIMSFMSSAPDGYASLEDVADAIHAYNPNRPRPHNLEGLRKNVRQQSDGRWHWHWDPKFLRIGDEPARAVDTARLYEAARNITIPTLLVRGTRSDIVSPESAAELLRLIPTAKAVEVEAGHMIAGDDNDVFSAHLLEFLSSTTDLAQPRDTGAEVIGSKG
jgi:pimeloyl-ACP methyl ester carboxylesterase